MAKKALVSKLQQAGNTPTGKQVYEVVEVGQEFEVHEGLAEWINCPDNVESFKYWYTVEGTFKKLPDAVCPMEALGEIAVNENDQIIEKYVWNWDTETWSKETLATPIDKPNID